MRSGAVAILFGAAFLVAGIGAVALHWTRDRAYYAEFARTERLDAARFHFRSGDRTVPIDRLLAIDDDLRSYVLCACGDRLAHAIDGDAFFKESERSHLRDVAGVYRWVGPVTTGAALLALVGLALDRRALRRAALVDAGLVLGVGMASAVAFEPAFLLFHRVFFPQGNFLFDPSADNIVLLYPEGYWLGVTVRVGATFILAALLFSALVSLPIRFTAPARERITS